jgi:hypothetical protein
LIAANDATRIFQNVERDRNTNGFVAAAELGYASRRSMDILCMAKATSTGTTKRLGTTAATHLFLDDINVTCPPQRTALRLPAGWGNGGDGNLVGRLSDHGADS